MVGIVLVWIVICYCTILKWRRYSRHIHNSDHSFGWIRMIRIRMYIIHVQNGHHNDGEIDIFIFHDYRSNEN